MTRNPTRTPSAEQDPVRQNEDASRAAKIKAMREAYLSGTLDLSVPDDENGLRRLLRDVFSASGGPRVP